MIPVAQAVSAIDRLRTAVTLRHGALLGVEDLGLHVGAELTGAADHGGAESQPFRLESGESAGEIAGMVDDRLDQRVGVAGGLGDAHADMGPCDEGGVADDDGPPAQHHARGFEILDRLDEGLRRPVHHFGELGRQQVPRVAAECLR